MNPNKSYDCVDFNTTLRPDLNDEEIASAKAGMVIQIIGFAVMSYALVGGWQGPAVYFLGFYMHYFMRCVWDDVPRIKAIQKHFDLDQEGCDEIES